MSEKTELELLSHSEADTEAVGRAIGLAAQGGELVGLVGQLGAGKTRLVKGIAVGLGLTEDDQVRSPSFVLIREHLGRLELFHVDAYRLAGPTELWSLGLGEILAQGGLTVLEWADRVAEALPGDRLTVELDIAGPKSRYLRLSCRGPQSSKLLSGIRGNLADF